MTTEQTSNNRHLTVGLLWHSLTSDNLGVGALTMAHMDIVRAAAKRANISVDFKVLCWRETREPYGLAGDVTIENFRLADFANPVGGFIDKARACDIVLDIGAGDSFSDIYGQGRIMKMIAAQRLVRLAGRPLVLSPQTIGPFSSGMTRNMALSVMRGAAMVAARDDLSIAYAREIGFEDDIVEASDVALKLNHDAPRARTGDRIRVGLNISGLLFNGGYTGNNMFGLQMDYAALQHDIIRFFRTAPHVELHLVGHVISDTNETEDDYRVAAQLAEEFPGVTLAPKFGSPVEAKSYIAGMDFFIGARMHACIAAFSAGVPVVPLAYSRKFEGLFGALGYDLTADCKSETAEDILSHIKRCFAERRRIEADMKAPLEKGLARLDAYEAALTPILAALPQRGRDAFRAA